MRSFFAKAVVLAASVVALAGAFVMPAAGDPAPGARCDINSVGSGDLQDVDNALANGYNSAFPTSPTWCSWDATNPITGAIHDSITLKPGCTIVRPAGSSEGITALKNSSCVDFARSSRGPKPLSNPVDPTKDDVDPVTGLPLLFVRYLQDTVQYALSGTTPTHGSLTLTAADLKRVYQTPGITWNQADPTNPSTAPIQPMLPQSGTFIRSFFLASIGVNDCVLDTTTCPNGYRPDITIVQANDPTVIQNNPDALAPFSVTVYRTKVPPGVIVLDDPLAGGYSASRFGYHVARNAGAAAAPVIPTYLQPILGDGTAGSGYICSPAGQSIIASYGFDTIPTCGVIDSL